MNVFKKISRSLMHWQLGYNHRIKEYANADSVCLWECWCLSHHKVSGWEWHRVVSTEAKLTSFSFCSEGYLSNIHTYSLWYLQPIHVIVVNYASKCTLDVFEKAICIQMSVYDNKSIKAYTHKHEITNETSNDKSSQRQFIHTATSTDRNVDESKRCF